MKRLVSLTLVALATLTHGCTQPEPSISPEESAALAEARAFVRAGGQLPSLSADFLGASEEEPDANALLRNAADNGYLRVAGVLLAAGADVRSPDRFERTPLALDAPPLGRRQGRRRDGQAPSG